MDNKQRIFYGLWISILLIGVVFNRFLCNEISSGEYYLCLIGFGIWLTLLNMFDDEDW